MDTLCLKPTEVADQLRVSRAKAYELIASKEIPSIKVGGRARVTMDALREYLARQAETSPPRHRTR
jgi:excisionase family DNA binding protein